MPFLLYLQVRKMQNSKKMGKNADKSDANKYNLLIALEKTLGNVTKACEMCKLHRDTYYDYIKKDKEFERKVKEVDELRIDFVESKLFERIKGYEHKETKLFNYKGKIIQRTVTKHYPPDSGLISFFLETKAQHRGYQRKVINENVNKDPFEGMTEEEIDEMLAEVEAEEQAEKVLVKEREANFKKVDDNDDL